MSDKMFGWIGRAVTARPWLVIVGWVVAAAALIGFAPSLNSITNTDQAAFLPKSAESAQAAALASRAFPATSGTTSVIVVTRRDGKVLTDSDVSRVGDLAQRLQVDQYESVRAVVFDPTMQTSPNRMAALIGVQFTAAPEDEAVRHAVSLLRDDTKATLAGTSLTSGMTGAAAIVVDNKKAFADAEMAATIATLTLIVILLLIIFRSPVAALLPLVTIGLVYGVATSVAAWAGTLFHFQVGQESPILLTVVLFGIGTDYILFLLFRYRERLRAGDEPRQAIIAAVARVGEAVFSAAFAVIAAFAALLLATLGFFTTLGPVLAAAVFVMLLASITLVPAVVAVLGRRLFWPSKVAPARRSGFGWLGRFVARMPWVVIAASVAILGGLGAGALTFHPTYDPVAQLPGKTEAVQAFTDLKKGFPAGALQPTDVYLTADRAIDQKEIFAFMLSLAGVKGVASPMQPTVSADGRTVQVPIVLADDPFSSASLDLVAGPLRDAARAAAPPGTTVLVGGESMTFSDVRTTTQRDFNLIFPVAVGLFVLILVALLRSFLAPVYLVGMVVAGFIATLGGSTLFFSGALGHAGLAFSIPIVLYLFVTAIGTDYNILITARLREEIRDGRSPREAAALAVRQAGPSIAAAALILCGTFGSLLFTGLPFFIEIGFAVMVGIVLVAFVVSLLLVPAVTALIGRAAWWPGTRTPRVKALDWAEPPMASSGGRKP